MALRVDFTGTRARVRGNTWSFDAVVTGGLASEGAILSICFKKSRTDADPGIATLVGTADDSSQGIDFTSDTTATIEVPRSVTSLIAASTSRVWYQINHTNQATGLKNTTQYGYIEVIGWAGQDAYIPTELPFSAVLPMSFTLSGTASTRSLDPSIMYLGQSNIAFTRHADEPVIGESRTKNLAVGATSVASHWASGTALRARFIYEICNLPVDKPVMIMVANGESDLDGGDTNALAFETNMGALMDAIETAFATATGRPTTDIFWVMARLHANSTRGTPTGRAAVRTAQTNLAQARANCDMLVIDEIVLSLSDDSHWELESYRAAVVDAMGALAVAYFDGWAATVSPTVATTIDTNWTGAQQLAWYDADHVSQATTSGRVSQLTDRFGNGRHLPAPSTTAEPVLNATQGPAGTACIKFNGTNQYLVASSANWPTTNGTHVAYLLVRVDTYGSTDRVIANVRPTQLKSQATTRRRLTVRNTTTDEEASSAAQAAGTWMAVRMEFLDDCFVKIRIGNRAEAITTIPTPSTDTTIQVSLGAVFNGSSFAECSIREAVFVTTSTEQQDANISDIWNAQYGSHVGWETLEWDAPAEVVEPEDTFPTEIAAWWETEPGDLTIIGEPASDSPVSSFLERSGTGFTFAAASNRMTYNLSQGGTAGVGTNHRPVIKGDGTQWLASANTILAAGSSGTAYFRVKPNAVTADKAFLYLKPFVLYFRTSLWEWRDNGTGEHADMAHLGTLVQTLRLRWTPTLLAIRLDNGTEVTATRTPASTTMDVASLLSLSGASIATGEVSDLLILDTATPTDQQDYEYGGYLNRLRRGPKQMGW